MSEKCKHGITIAARCDDCDDAGWYRERVDLLGRRVAELEASLACMLACVTVAERRGWSLGQIGGVEQAAKSAQAALTNALDLPVCTDPACYGDGSPLETCGCAPCAKRRGDLVQAGSLGVSLAEAVSMFPVRTCETCGWRTTSTSTIDWCIKCKTDGLRPKHFLTREKTSTPVSSEANIARLVRVGDKIRYRGWSKTHWPDGHEVREVTAKGFVRTLARGNVDVRREHVSDWMHADGARIDSGATFGPYDKKEKSNDNVEEERTRAARGAAGEGSEGARTSTCARAPVGAGCGDEGGAIRDVASPDARGAAVGGYGLRDTRTSEGTVTYYCAACEDTGCTECDVRDVNEDHDVVIERASRTNDASAVVSDPRDIALDEIRHLVGQSYHSGEMRDDIRAILDRAREAVEG